MNEAIFAQVQKEMDESVSALRKELAKLRTGRASTALLEHIVVEYYGATTPLNQLATLSAPEARADVAPGGDVIGSPVAVESGRPWPPVAIHLGREAQKYGPSIGGDLGGPAVDQRVVVTGEDAAERIRGLFGAAVPVPRLP